MFLTILVFILVLSVLVFFHELGHFVAARKSGIKVDEFGIGFPPRAFCFYKAKNNKWKFKLGRAKIEDNIDVIYSINLFPLGGFVKIKGQDGDNQDKDSFAKQKTWKRAIVISAGVFMNVVLAWILMSIILMMGSYQSKDELKSLPSSVRISDEKVMIFQVMEESPAYLAGIKTSDSIISINNQDVFSEADIQNIVNSSNNDELIFKVERDEEIKEISVIAEFNEELDRKTIGIAMSSVAFVKYPWYLSFVYGIKVTFSYLWAIIYAFYDLIRGLILGQGVSVEVAGPVGIANLTGQMARMGIIYLIHFTAILSLNLAVINFLPFPALDGGRLIFLIIEKIKGSPVKQNVEAVFHNVGFLLLMLLVVWVTFKDILGVLK